MSHSSAHIGAEIKENKVKCEENKLKDKSSLSRLFLNYPTAHKVEIEEKQI